MLTTTRKTILALALTLAPMSAFAQTTDTTTPATTGDTSTTGSTNTTGTGTTDNTNRNDNSNWGWLGLLGLAGLAGLRRQPVVMVPDNSAQGTRTNRA